MLIQELDESGAWRVYSLQKSQRCLWPKVSDFNFPLFL
jgi:hypothetical protein